jgi:hypothetical protein
LLAIPAERHQPHSAPTDDGERVCQHALPEVAPAWEDVCPSTDLGSGMPDAWAGCPLHVPEIRNNHFFVRRMDEFVFEDAEMAPSAAPGE